MSSRPATANKRRRLGDIVQNAVAAARQSASARRRLISDDEVESLHLAALDILERIGVRCQVKEARDIFAGAGAIIDEADGRVRVGRDIVEQRSRPRRRNHAHAAQPGPRSEARRQLPDHRGGAGAAQLHRSHARPALRHAGRSRPSFLKLTQFFNAVQMNGWPVEPLDIEVSYRHLDAALAMLTLTDKVPYVFCQSRQRIRDVLEMCAIARGETLEQFAQRPGVFSIINTNTPLQYDVPMTIGVMDMARYGQPTLLTPFVMAGASTPATIASAMALNTAEVLFGADAGAIGAARRAGALWLCRHECRHEDRSARLWACRHATAARMIGGQMARRYGCRCARPISAPSNIADFASGYESANSRLVGA